jgi:hypothetical protein
VQQFLFKLKFKKSILWYDLIWDISLRRDFLKSLLMLLVLGLLLLQGCEKEVITQATFMPQTSSKIQLNNATTNKDNETSTAKENPPNEKQAVARDIESEPVYRVLTPLQSINHWTVTMTTTLSKSNLTLCLFKLTYEGSLKAENIKVNVGNATANWSSLYENQNIEIGSTFSDDTKQIVFTLNWKEGEDEFQKSLLFKLN